MTMPLKLSDTQLMLLSAASQRQDLLLTPPDHLKGGATKAVTSKLLAGGLIEEVTVSPADQHWRTAEDGRMIGLRVTPTGLQVIGIEEDRASLAQPQEDSAEPMVADLAQGLDRLEAADPEEPAGTVTEPTPARELQATAQPLAPRGGTKQALVLSLLSSPEGATLDDLLSATGWLPHTTRAALTGLRQKGYAVTRSKDRGGESVYRIAATALPESVRSAPEPAEV